MQNKNILIIKNNFKSYASVITYVNADKPIDLILQQVGPNTLNSKAVHDINSWLKKKGYPLIVTSCTMETVINNIEMNAGSLFDTYPKRLHNQIVQSDSLLVGWSKNSPYCFDSLSHLNWSDSILEEKVQDCELKSETKQLLFQLRAFEHLEKSS